MSLSLGFSDQMQDSQPGRRSVRTGAVRLDFIACRRWTNAISEPMIEVFQGRQCLDRFRPRGAVRKFFLLGGEPFVVRAIGFLAGMNFPFFVLNAEAKDDAFLGDGDHRGMAGTEIAQHDAILVEQGRGCSFP